MGRAALLADLVQLPALGGAVALLALRRSADRPHPANGLAPRRPRPGAAA